MTGDLPPERDPKIWVKSKGGIWYWRHPTGSTWKGPRRDRVWVPSIDAPSWLPPPPDDFANIDAEEGNLAPAPIAPTHQFGTTAPARPGAPSGAAAPAGIPIPSVALRPSPFGNSGSSTGLWGGNALPAPGPRPSYTTTGAVTYTGAFANTMRRRDESRAEQEHLDRERLEAQRDRERREFERSQREREQRERERREDRERLDREEREREHRRFEGAQEEHRGDYYHHGSSYGGSSYSHSPRRHHNDYGHATPRRDVRNSFTDMLHGGSHREERRSQDRAKEERLRDLARNSRGPRAPSSTKSSEAKPHTVLDVDKAALDTRGQPILPTTAYDEDESEYGGTDDSDDEDAALKKYRARESIRVGEARRKEGAESPPAEAAPAPPESVGAGRWGTLRLSTAPAMRNLLRWMAAGCPYARATFKYLRDYYAHHPTAARSDGIQLMLREQARAERSWVLVTTGYATPMSRRPTASGAPPEPTRNDRRKMKRVREAKSAARRPSGPTLPPTLLPRIPPDRDAPDRKTPTVEEDVEMEAPPAGPPANPLSIAPPPIPATPAAPTIWEASFLGFSLAPAHELASSNPLGAAGNLADSLQYMSTISPSTWMHGVRLEDGTWPDASTPTGMRPLPNDVLASRTIQFLAPQRLGSSLHHSRFIAEVLTGFSVAGLFEHFVREGRYVRGSHRIEDYPWDGQNFNMSMGFAWVVMHGVWAGTPASRLIHEFARSWRNYRERNTDPTGDEFQTAPHNASEIGSWAAANMIHWNDLRHGPLRPGVTTDQPQIPALVYPAPVDLEDTEMKDEETVELTTEEIVGIPLPPSNPGSPSTPASPPADKRGEDETSGNELTPNAERPNSLLNIDRFLFARV
ncbi:hypothetical protein DFH06DRAFT_1121690 [Mycena polygramma]|nr:hypothetical protein DFH06DRAFT_1121690 [Mycena polygramma]